jgi:hypothetical protein
MCMSPIQHYLGSQDHGTFGKSLLSGNPQCTSLYFTHPNHNKQTYWQLATRREFWKSVQDTINIIGINTFTKSFSFSMLWKDQLTEYICSPLLLLCCRPMRSQKRFPMMLYTTTPCSENQYQLLIRPTQKEHEAITKHSTVLIYSFTKFLGEETWTLVPCTSPMHAMDSTNTSRDGNGDFPDSPDIPGSCNAVVGSGFQDLKSIMPPCPAPFAIERCRKCQHLSKQPS